VRTLVFVNKLVVGYRFDMVVVYCNLRGKDQLLCIIVSRNVSSLFLKPIIESHAIKDSSRVFHMSTTLCAKENVLVSRRRLG